VTYQEFRERGVVVVFPKVERGWRGWLHLVRNFTWASGRLQGDQEFLEIYVGRRYGGQAGGAMMLSRAHVTSVQLRPGSNYSGVRFESDDDDRIVTFRSQNAELIVDRLRVMGWSVAD
jgi:hypothetical protein